MDLELQDLFLVQLELINHLQNNQVDNYVLQDIIAQQSVLLTQLCFALQDLFENLEQHTQDQLMELKELNDLLDIIVLQELKYKNNDCHQLINLVKCLQLDNLAQNHIIDLI